MLRGPISIAARHMRSGNCCPMPQRSGMKQLAPILRDCLFRGDATVVRHRTPSICGPLEHNVRGLLFSITYEVEDGPNIAEQIGLCLPIKFAIKRSFNTQSLIGIARVGKLATLESSGDIRYCPADERWCKNGGSEMAKLSQV
jgi:hypothetical protein